MAVMVGGSREAQSQGSAHEEGGDKIVEVMDLLCSGV